MFEPIEEIQVNGVQDAENILKSIGFESADSLIEKAKWKVGDEKQYQGVTWVVGGFNAKGAPLWRKKKDGGGNATPAAQTSATAAKTPSTSTSASAGASNKTEEKPIVPNAILQYGNRPSRQLDKLYKDFDEKYKNYTADQLQKEIDKMGNAIYNEKYMYRAMQRDGAGKISLNKQGNRVDEVIAKSYTLKRLLETKKANSGSDKTTSSPKTDKTSGSSGIPTKEQALKKIDDFTSNFKINTFYSNRTPSWISNYAFGLSERLRQEKFPWLDKIGVKEQILAMKYVIASSASGGAKEIAKNLNESKLGAKWQVESESPIIKLKTEDYMGNVSYLTISKHSKKSK